MDTREARTLGRRAAELVSRGRIEEAYALCLPALQSRTPFRLLDLIGQAVGAGPLEQADAFAERVAAEGTEAGWAVIAGLMRERLEPDMPGAFERARAFIVRAGVWYAADILGERVPGPALLAEFEKALALLRPWRTDADRWVRRTVGVAVHFWAKRALGDPTLRPQAEALLTLLEPMFEEHDIDAVKGVGWGLKTLGRHYPGPVGEWLARQTGRRPRALMLRKALTYLPPAQREPSERGFAP
jgi:hypothetical protein